MERNQIIPLLFACAVAALVDDTASSGDRSTMLLEKIRKQLMNDNYDYMPTEIEEAVPVSSPPTPPAQSIPTPRKDDDQLDSNVNDHFVPRAQDDVKSIDVEEANSRAVDKKDLLYYVDDDKLKKVTDEYYQGDDVETTTPKKKYKVLKVKHRHPSRRSGSVRRFIQEVGGGGVALINLGSGPFPQFRLPPARRQYMMDHDQEDDEPDGTELLV